MDQMNTTTQLSIIICTYNRANVLLDCLDCFTQQTEKAFELIIVDNASTDDSPKIIQKYEEGKDWVKSIVCEEVGLSLARNCGAGAAKSEWIGYVDDDALVESNFVSKVLMEIERGDFDAFGGVYTPWYKFGRPCWYSDTYGGNAHIFVKTGRQLLMNGEYFSGGIAFYRRELIISGGFSSEFGMKGNLIGYGEENVMQDGIRLKGHQLGVVPAISMLHLVAEYKLNVRWHLKSQFESGRSHSRQFGRGFMLIALLRLFTLPLLRLRELPDGGYQGVGSLLSGAMVMFLRGFSYYLGRMSSKRGGEGA